MLIHILLLVNKITQKRPHPQNNIPHLQTLESHNGIPQNKKHPTRHDNAQPQKHPEHVTLHSTNRL